MRTSGTSRTGAAAGAIIAGALALTAAACGSNASPAASGTSQHAMKSHHAMASHSPMAHDHAMAATARFGSDCGMVPATGMGSFHSMGMDPVVTAASHSALLTTFAKDVKAAGITGALDSMRAITVFAPANSAFMKVTGTAMTMMHSPAELAKILKYHVVSGRVTPAQLASGKPLTTLEGGVLKPSKMGSVYEVNNADVLCGNVQTANATVYVINKVLIPMH